MSGILAIVNLNGQPVDLALLGWMTDYLRFRGPDAQGVRVINCVALAHTFLRLTDSPDHEEQPFTLDGSRWIVADARVDARQDLIAKLRTGGQDDLAPDATDAELIVRAYRLWGEDCVSHLLGDFTFAVWDESRQHLFCARDHLGVKPLFYARVGHAVVVSNTLDCIRLHPAVSRELNDLAVADFLLFGVNQDAGTTTFRDIRRLPPAHSITWSRDSTRGRRYWTLPVDDPIHFKRADDYADRFIELLSMALRDRLCTRRVGVMMSGGVDSPTLAAVALSLLRERPAGFSLQAITSVYDRLIPDRERYFAGLVANHLNIPIRYDVRDDETSIAEWDQVSIHTPEPVDNPPAAAASIEFLQAMAGETRVFLYGEGPDNALQYEWRPYLAHLLARWHVTSFARAVASDLWMHRRIPLWGSIRQMAAAPRQKRRWPEVFPDWLNEEFSRRCACRERWNAHLHASSASQHPVRPRGYNGFAGPRWQSLFEDCDINGASSRTEIRYPFLDLRLLQYMLALPAMPWCRNKLIIRRSMRATLPAEVLRRPKASIPVSPDFMRVLASGFPRLVPTPDLLTYVIPDRIATPQRSPELPIALRPLGLNHWLRDLSSGYKDGFHETARCSRT